MTHKILFSIAFSAVLLSGCTTTHTPAPDIERKHYSEWEKDVGYTRVIRIGNTLHLAGLGGQGETQAEQIDSIYQTINDILADYHATTSDIVREVVYTIDIDELIAAQEIRKKHFNDGRYPASTWVQIERLYSPDMKIEVEVTVHLPQR